MGLFPTGLALHHVDTAAIAENIRPALYAWFDGHVQVFDPQQHRSSDYNALDDSGGESNELIVLDSGAQGALIQPIRGAVETEFGGQNVGLLGIRFQIRRDRPVNGALHSGLRVRVLASGNDDQLTESIFSLVEGVDSSLAFGRILEATLITGPSSRS